MPGGQFADPVAIDQPLAAHAIVGQLLFEGFEVEVVLSLSHDGRTR